MTRIPRRLSAALVPLAVAAAVPASASAATAFYGVTADNKLVEFQSDNTSQAPAKAIRGLATGERITGIDLRPADGRLYGLTSTSRIVVINPRNAAISYVGPKAFAPALSGDGHAFDFNPVRDRIRVETHAAQNLRIDPATGQLETIKETVPDTDSPAPTTPGAPAPTKEIEKPGVPDANLQYPAGDPGAGTAPRVGAAGYTFSFPAGAATELFVLDAARNTLAKQDPENAGTLRTVGALGTTGDPVAFDIGPNNTGYAAIGQSGGKVGLYRVNLSTGKADREISVNAVGSRQPLVGLAAAGSIADDKRAPGLSVSSSSTQLRSRLLAGGLQLTVNCDEACAGEARVRVNGKTIGRTDAAVEGGAGYKRVAVPLDRTTRERLRDGRSVLLDLRVRVADGAGNTRTLERPIRAR